MQLVRQRLSLTFVTLLSSSPRSLSAARDVIVAATVPFADYPKLSDFCFWHQADIPQHSNNVRFWGKADMV